MNIYGPETASTICRSCFLENHDCSKCVTQTKETTPAWQKYMLTAEEASEYFNIGINKLRVIISQNPRADWLIMNGNRTLIKRKKFEQFIDRIDSI